MSDLVLDASAILAAILGEAGGDAVFASVDAAAVSTVNVAEVYTYAAINALPTDAIDAFFADTAIEVVAFELGQAVDAGGLAADTRKAGLSLGDRACLSLARARGIKVLTADRPWLKVADAIGVSIELLRE